MKQNDSNQVINSNFIELSDVYTNACSINFNKYEVEITLGLGSSNYETVKPLVNIRMSPQFANEFCDSLVNNLKKFEEMRVKS